MIAATDIDGIVSYVWTHHEGDMVLIVGHDNTVPDIIGEFGAVPPVDPIPADEYDKLFTLLAVAENAAVVITEYGDPSPPPDR